MKIKLLVGIERLKSEILRTEFFGGLAEVELLSKFFLMAHAAEDSLLVLCNLLCTLANSPSPPCESEGKNKNQG
jgi:hypothetical protein